MTKRILAVILMLLLAACAMPKIVVFDVSLYELLVL